MSGKQARPLQVIPGLALSNLRHDWILTSCLVVALAAVIAPLLILLGMKYGTIHTLRERLVNDPVYREVRPAQIYEFDAQWFAEMEEWPEVQFIVPSILPLSSILHVQHPKSGSLEMFDLVTTGPGDPLLVQNGALVPAEGECVLSAEAARRLGLGPGDILPARATRSRAGQREMAAADVRVAGVLDPRAGSLPRIYAPLAFVRDVEAYKKGYAVPALGWEGESPEPFLSYDGLVLLMSQSLDPIARTGLIINTGFARIQKISSALVKKKTGIPLPDAWTAYDLGVPGSVVTTSGIRAMRQKLRGTTHVLLPYVQKMQLDDARGRPVQPIGLSLTAAQARNLGLSPLPWGGFTGRASPGPRLLQALLPPGAGPEQTLAVQGASAFSVGLKSKGQTELESIVVPAELMGVLRTAMHSKVLFDPEAGEFAAGRGGYRGFRLYTHSIDHVPDVYQRLEGKGIETIAQVEAIQRIQVLDSGLGRLYALLAGLGISGGAAVLLSSLYAAVERLRRDLGILRLVGLDRRHVFCLPLIQGVLVAAAGLGAGFVGYAFLAQIINRSFAAELAAGEAFCTLPPAYVAGIVLLTFALALVSSLAAAWRATRIDPAEVIRDT